MKKNLRYSMMLTVCLLFIVSQLSAQSILCVDRDFGGPNTSDYTDTWPPISRALDAAGYTYDYWEVLEGEDNGPNASEMGEYDVVIWFTGEAWQAPDPMTAVDESELLLYTSLGGKLFLNAQDYLYAMYPNAGTFASGSFPNFVLGLEEVVQDVYQIEPGDPNSIGDSAMWYGIEGSLAEGMQFTTKDIFTTDDGLYGDSIVGHLGQGLIGLTYPYNSPGPPAIQYEAATHRSVFTTIDIAAITDTIKRDILMHRIVDWLAYGPTGVDELSKDESKLVVMPNPVKDFVNIGMVNSMEELHIYNNQGQVVYQQDVNQATQRIDLSHLPSGMYFVKAKTASGISTSKLMKK